MTVIDKDATAATLLHAWDEGTQLTPMSQAYDLSIEDSYAIAGKIAEMRLARGERSVGRKIGFTNRSIWARYGVDAPMWSWMYDTTVAALPKDGVVTLPNLAEPRIEPEIAFHFDRSPEPGMSIEDIAACADWMAHGFEIVTSPFPGWNFSLVDCTAAQSLHGRFWYGPRQALPEDVSVLERFTLSLQGPGKSLSGHATDVLDGPLHAVRFLLDEIAKMPGAAAIQPGEIVTTGTLTDAGAVSVGETWETAFDGINLPGLKIHFAN